MKPWLSTLTFIGFEINAAIEAGHGDTISFDDVYSGIQRKRLLYELNEKLPRVFDFSLFPPGSDQERGFHDAMDLVAGGLEGRESRKVGIKKNGLCLVIAFILEAIQHKEWETPSR